MVSRPHSDLHGFSLKVASARVVFPGLLAVTTALVLAACSVSSPDRYSLVWSEEFNDNQLDPQVWFVEQGDGSQYGIPGWGNNELQHYQQSNVRLEDGVLLITAKLEPGRRPFYSSARINTRDRFVVRYGRIEASMRFPVGQGLWSAFWLLPQDEVYGEWAASGEIDIVEAVDLGVGDNKSTLHTIHFGGAWPDNKESGARYDVPADPTRNFHVYAVEWDEANIRWYVDDVLVHAETNWSTDVAEFPAPFNQDFYLLINLAVGGNLTSGVDSSSLPATLEVDYVRVYSERNELG